MLKNIIFIGGINGTGKTLVAKKFAETMKLPFYDGSNELMKELKIKNGDYKKLRNLSEKDKRNALKRVFDRLSKSHSNSFLVITGHYVKVLNNKISKYDGEWFDKCKCLIHIKTKPKIILKRITMDENQGIRNRKMFNSKVGCLDFIKFAQKMSQENFLKFSNKYDSIPLTIENNTDVNSAISAICNSIKFKSFFI